MTGTIFSGRAAPCERCGQRTAGFTSRKDHRTRLCPPCMDEEVRAAERAAWAAYEKKQLPRRVSIKEFAEPAESEVA